MFGRRNIDTDALQSELQEKQEQLLARLEALGQDKKRGRGGRFWFGILLGGTLGAAAFYLFDPEKGEERRQGLLGAAGGGADAAAQRDQEINARVEADVFRDSSVPQGQININTVDGVVYVRGTVATQELISDIEERAKKVSGVDAVINLLRLPAPAK